MKRAVQTISAIALALSSSVASGVELSGRIGGRYEQSELRTPEATGGREDWLLEGALSGAGSVFGAGIVDWSGDVGYGQWNQTYFDSGQSSPGIRRKDLGYRAAVGIFKRPGSIFGLDLQLGRTRSDDLNVQLSPSTLTTSSSIGFHYSDGLRPQIAVAVSRLETETPLPLTGTARRNVDSLDASFKHTAGGTPYGVDYRGDRSTGTFDTDNYDRHDVHYTTRSSFSPSTTGYVDGRYMRRTPTRSGGLNPLVETNVFFAGADWVGGPTTSRTQYAYTRALVSDATTPISERTLNSVTERVEHTSSRELRYTGILEGSLDFDGRDGVDNRAGVVAATGLLRRSWFRPASEIQVELGPIVGVVDPFDQDLRPGYGGVLNGGVTFGGETSRTRLGLNSTYKRDLEATAGWILQHYAFLDTEKLLSPTVSVRAGASVDAAQTSTAAFGRNASRTVLVNAGLRWRRVTAKIDGGLRSGFAALSADRVPAGEALMLPYDAHTRYVTATLWIPLGTTIAVSGSGRYSQSVSPDRPTLEDKSAIGTGTWSVGGLSLSVEDRYTVRSEADRTLRENVILVRATRAFGTRF